MARRVTTLLTDDLNGDPAHETLKFGLDGVDYEIDLSEDNATRLRDHLADYVDSARKLRRERKTPATYRRTRVPADGNATQTRAIREWARSQDIEVSDRGRLPAEVVERYELAHA